MQKIFKPLCDTILKRPSAIVLQSSRKISLIQKPICPIIYILWHFERHINPLCLPPPPIEPSLPIAHHHGTKLTLEKFPGEVVIKTARRQISKT